jgi:hypothetical protein
MSTTKARTIDTVLFTGQGASLGVFIHAVAVSPFFLSGTLTCGRISLVNINRKSEVLLHMDGNATWALTGTDNRCAINLSTTVVPQSGVNL